MRLLYLDCSAGIAGDMLLAALLDLGANFAYVKEGLHSLKLPEAWEIELRETERRGIRAKQLIVTVEGQVTDLPSSDHDHHHHHHHHDHHGHHHEHDDHAHGGVPARPYREIRDLLQRSLLPDRVRRRAGEVFAELAKAEGAVHGVPPDDVHFHEVGSTDAIIDIVGVALALESLDVDEVVASPLHLGTGFVTAAHGRLPVPAPATLRLIEGLSVYQTDIVGELVTPTGAALVRALCRETRPMPPMRILRSGWGAGAKDFPIPNVLRAVLGEVTHPGEQAARTVGPREGFDAEDFDSDEVIELTANVDDMTPQLLGAAIDTLLGAGALDAWVTPAVMKKGRPGHVLHALVPVDACHRVASRMLQESTSLGLRLERRQRLMLGRRWIEVETSAGPVRVKIGHKGDEVWNVAPEYEDCLKAASQLGVPLKRVIAEAQKAALETLEADDAS